MRTNAAWQTKLMHFARKLKCYRAHKHSESVEGPRYVRVTFHAFAV